MLKFSLFGLALSSALILTTNSEAVSPIGNSVERPSFEQAYIDPEISKLESCESAEIYVMFEEEYIRYHVAEYLATSLDTASKCGDVDLTITPTQVESVTAEGQAMNEAQIRELTEILEAHNFDADITEPVIVEDQQTLVLNGLAAIVRITPAASSSDA